jgi:hypothetical protein
LSGGVKVGRVRSDSPGRIVIAGVRERFPLIGEAVTLVCDQIT